MKVTAKALSLLGLAKKAGRLSAGHDAVLEALQRKKSVLIILAADASARVEREMKREVTFQNSSAQVVRIQYTMAEIGRALPHKVGVVSVNDASFASAVLKAIEEG